MTLHVLPTPGKGRQLPSWIDGFMEYTQQIWTIDPFRRWTAICAIAGALERKVWVRSQGSNIYPNLYVFLVGPPAIGKTRPIEVCEQLWQQSLNETHHIAKVSLTKASFIDELSAANRVVHALDPATYNSLLVASKELKALLPEYDRDFLGMLTFLYDGVRYDEKRRGNPEPVVIERPVVNLIGACTSAFLLETLPDVAWNDGFLSRVIIIHRDIVAERELDLLQEEREGTHPLAKALIHDMRLIGEQIGKIPFERDAAVALSKWHADKSNRPVHPRLQHYNSRRSFNAIKLCMISAVDRNVPSVELQDVTSATEWLQEAEVEMANMFLSFRAGSDTQVISDAHHWLRTMEVRGRAGVPSRLMYEFLAGKLPSYKVTPTIELMIRAGLIRAEVKEGVTLFFARANSF